MYPTSSAVATLFSSKAINIDYIRLEATEDDDQCSGVKVKLLIYVFVFPPVL